MRNLFCRNGLLNLRAFCAAPGGVVCAFDFDGTLAPIVERPGDARMSVIVEERLTALAKLCDVVVISGRSITDLRARIPVPGVLLAGNHGLESPFVSEAELTLSRASSDAWKVLLESAGVSSFPGVELEHKVFSLARSRKIDDDVARKLVREIDLLEARLNV